jgi:hypothetical protein
MVTLVARLRWLPFDALVWLVTRVKGTTISLPATHPAHVRSECHECRLVDFELNEPYVLHNVSADELRAEWRSRGMDLDRAERTFNVDLPCPSCGQDSLFGYLLLNERGEHMHTHYVCRFWRSGIKPDLSASLHKHCGWHGWSVPGCDFDVEIS